jgi:hypothetical protein
MKINSILIFAAFISAISATILETLIVIGTPTNYYKDYMSEDNKTRRSFGMPIPAPSYSPVGINMGMTIPVGEYAHNFFTTLLGMG